MRICSGRFLRACTLSALLSIILVPVMDAADTGMTADAMCALVKRASASEISMAIAQGGDIHGLSSNQRTALTEAVMWGAAPPVIQALLDGGSDVNAVGYYQRTPLFWCAWHTGNRPEMVGALRAAGADPLHRDMGGATALICSITDADRPDIVRALLAAGVDLQAVDKEGWTALDSARKYRRRGTVAVLLEAGAHSGGTPTAVLQTGTPSEVRALVTDTHLQLNQPGKGSRIPLIEAAAIIDDSAVIRELAALGGDFNVRDDWGYTPFMYAAMRNGNPDVISEMIRLGANVNVTKTGDRATPLMLLVSSNQDRATLVNLFLAAHADVAATDAKGRTALDLAEANPNGSGMQSVITALREAGAKRGGSIWDIVERGTAAEVTAALTAGANPNVRDENTWTLLMFAVSRNRDVAIIAALLKAGADPRAQDRWGSTVLMFLSREPAVVVPLIEAGADPNARDQSGRTPLMRCVANPSPAVISALLKAGADPSLEDQQGKTALELARDYHHEDVVGPLLKPLLPMDKDAIERTGNF